ncbi:hypothetical protein GCM10010303_28530 [Streptomyces purpurascens]|nr:hypothetical protein GCM10010303_28530 [Streptomyces purpurascens]
MAELERLLARVRLSVDPLVHPLNPMPGRERRARHVLALLDDCSRDFRGLVAVAADPEASPAPAWPPPPGGSPARPGAVPRGARPAAADVIGLPVGRRLSDWSAATPP